VSVQLFHYKHRVISTMLLLSLSIFNLSASDPSAKPSLIDLSHHVSSFASFRPMLTSLFSLARTVQAVSSQFANPNRRPLTRRVHGQTSTIHPRRLTRTSGLSVSKLPAVQSDPDSRKTRKTKTTTLMRTKKSRAAPRLPSCLYSPSLI
jgi:hypothetical protein